LRYVLAPMFANFLSLVTRRPPPGYDFAFVEQISVSTRPPRNRRMEQWILAGWMLITVKSFAVIWAIDHWRVPVNPLWVIVPTVLMAALCTLVYLRRK
jgi:peptidoglycan/LPS O-acetylase OafA/YrhL